MKKRWYRVQYKKNAPDQVWDYGMSWVSKTVNVTSTSSHYEKGRIPLEMITDINSDITKYLDFSFLQFGDIQRQYRCLTSRIRQVTWVYHRIGSLLSYWILLESGIPISCLIVQSYENLEQATEEDKERMMKFTDALKTKFKAISLDMSRAIRDVNAEKYWD